MGAVGPGFTLVDDNVLPHRVHLIGDILENEDIPRIDWPARCPDLNPIEHVWEGNCNWQTPSENPPNVLSYVQLLSLFV